MLVAERIVNDRIIAHFPQSAQVKEHLKLVTIGKKWKKVKWHLILRLAVYV